MAIGESRREVRTTWIGFAVIFAIVASVLLYKGRGSYVYFYGASAFFAAFAAFAPMALLPAYRAWAVFARALAWVNTRLLLGILFYLMITPLGLVLRALGKDPLERAPDPAADTYWAQREKIADPSRYYKQY